MTHLISPCLSYWGLWEMSSNRPRVWNTNPSKVLCRWVLFKRWKMVLPLGTVQGFNFGLPVLMCTSTCGYTGVYCVCVCVCALFQSTTLILWVPLIVMSVVQVVFSSWSFSACSSFLGLPCCPRHKPPREVNRPVCPLLATSGMFLLYLV